MEGRTGVRRGRGEDGGHGGKDGCEERARGGGRAWREGRE